MGLPQFLLIAACLAISSDEPSLKSGFQLPDPAPVRDRNDPLPITPNAHRIVRTDGTAGFALKLNIAPGVQVYSERPLEFGIPLRIQFLDNKFKAIPAKLVFPRNKARRVNGDPLPDYFVYENKDDLPLVVYGYPERAAKYATVYYHGFNKERMH